MSSDKQAIQLSQKIFNLENDQKLQATQKAYNVNLSLMNMLQLQIHEENLRKFLLSAQTLITEKRGEDEIDALFDTNQVDSEMLRQALNAIRNSNGQSLLNVALQNQNFAAANCLMKHGALASPEDRACFELAKDSKAGIDYGYPESKEGLKFEPVKNFGLTLGIVMTSADVKTYSQFGQIQPTYQLMTDFANRYASKHHENSNFKQIASAFTAANNSAQFLNSTSKNIPKAGEELHKRILSGKVTTIPINCTGHAMGLSVVPDSTNPNSGYLVFTNRGLGKKPNEAGTQIYKIDDLGRINPDFINSMINGHCNGSSHATIMKQVHQVTNDNAPIYSLKQKNQKYDNCTIANSRANVHGILLCLKGVDKGGFGNLSLQDIGEVRKEYKQYTHAMREEKVHELANAIKANPKDPDLITLAQKYLEQHPKATPDLRGPLEKVLNNHKQQQSKAELQSLKNMGKKDSTSSQALDETTTQSQSFKH